MNPYFDQNDLKRTKEKKTTKEKDNAVMAENVK